MRIYIYMFVCLYNIHYSCLQCPTHWETRNRIQQWRHGQTKNGRWPRKSRDCHSRWTGAVLFILWINRSLMKMKPFLIDDDLFTAYFPVFKRDKPKSLQEAELLLKTIVGTKPLAGEDFLKRVWRQGNETLSGYMFSLQNMAATLNIPEVLVKTQFFNGLPMLLARDLKAYTDATATLSQLAEKAENLIQISEPTVAVTVDENESIASVTLELKKLKEEINAIRRPLPNSTVCYRCGREGHIARNCGQPTSRQFRVGNNKTSPTFFKCGIKGHTAFRCSKN